jgi:hypothetical protein
MKLLKHRLIPKANGCFEIEYYEVDYDDTQEKADAEAEKSRILLETQEPPIL